MFVQRLLDQASERLVSISNGVPLIEAARLLRAHTDIVVVCDAAGTLAGVITKTDVVDQISHCQGASCITPTALVMTRSVVTCQPHDWVHDVWTVMKQRRLRNIPIINSETNPLGVLNARDVLEALLGEIESEEALLRDYVMSIGYR